MESHCLLVGNRKASVGKISVDGTLSLFHKSNFYSKAIYDVRVWRRPNNITEIRRVV